MSPDKDEWLAEEALQGTEPASACHIDHFDDSIIDPTLLAEEDYNNITRDLPVPSDDFDDTRMDLLARECTNNGIAHDIINKYHQHNCFSQPPDPSTLHNIRLQQQNSAFGNKSHSRGSGESSSITCRVQQPEQNSTISSQSCSNGSGESSTIPSRPQQLNSTAGNQSRPITSRVQQPEQNSTVGSQSHSNGSGESSTIPSCSQQLNSTAGNQSHPIASCVQQPDQNSTIGSQSHSNGSGESSTIPSHLQQQNPTTSNQSRSTGVEGTPSVPSQALSSDDPLGPLTGPPTKLHAYPHKFREVIEHAKQITQCECGLFNPFPNCSDFLNRKSGEHFTEAIAECQYVPTGYWLQYKKDLGTLLWEALMTWHSMLKAKAHELIPHFYALGEDLTPETNKVNAKLLICQSAFTCNGVNEEGSTNNMAAPALAALVISFFYTGPSALGVLFPEVFGREVPEVTLCAAIDEYVVSGSRQDQTFEYVGYSKIFANFYSMQLAINKDPKHAVKTKALRVEWAASTITPMEESGNVVAFDTDFQPVLD